MTESQIEQIRLLMQLFEHYTPAQARSYLAQHCRDSVVRAEVEALLAKRNQEQIASPFDATLTEQPTRPSAANSADMDPNEYFDNLIGKKFNDTYSVLEKLGQGGMGAVFRCKHLFLGTQVAIKVMSPRLKKTSNDVKRFQREARVGWSLSHPNIIKVQEFSQTAEGVLFMVMEYMPGVTLKNVIKKSAPMPLRDCLDIMQQLCGALDVAHKRNILHRDLKPSNILISEKDNQRIAKLADFGIVKLLEADSQLTTEGTVLTSTGTVIGSLDYMSPEQLMSYKLGPTSDIYSLGVILHEMLTGELPINGFTLQEIIRLKTSYTKLPPPSQEFDFITPELDQIFYKVLAPSPQQRYQKAEELFNALSKAAQ